MKVSPYLLYCMLFFFSISFSQSKSYTKNKLQKIKEGSVFTQIINKKLPATVEYEDEDVIAFVPLRLQAPVHLLIVPKKEIYTVNDASQDDTFLLGKLILVAKRLAKEKGIAKTGYRLAINTNEDSGQSVFHIHLHLLGGKKLGPMVTQDDQKTDH